MEPNIRSYRWQAVFRRMPIRARLVLAFALLIVTSASATILIGNTVFGNRADELACDLAAMYANVSSNVLNARLADMRQFASAIASRSVAGENLLSLGRVAGSERQLDFVLVYHPSTPSMLLRLPLQDQSEIAPVNLSRDQIRGFVRALTAGPQKGAVSGIAKVPRGGIAWLTGRSAGGEMLLLFAAAPTGRPDGSLLVTGRLLDGRADLLREMQQMVSNGHKDDLVLTLFMGDQAIACTEGERSLAARADANVSQAVLGRGEPFVGIAGSSGESLYSAYLPLRDVSGNIVGMLAAGSRGDAMAGVRRRTTTLFTSLILGGTVFGFIMTYLLSVWLVSPVSQLAEGVSRVAGGDLNHVVRIESADELGKLARAFNAMVQTIKQRDQALKEVTETRLTRVEKQVSIGRLAAGVAHEINNPLTAILTLSKLWLKKMPEDDPRREDLEIIVIESSRCREIVQNLLEYARERPLEKRLIDVNAVVREARLLADKYDPMGNVKIEMATARLPLIVNADPKLLQQVFINLLLNGAEATERGGVVRIQAGEDPTGTHVQIKVIDNGKGIPEKDIHSVFEPFFTTKITGKGTGLGLSVSLGIVQKHGGTIEIESREGKWTTVTVLLPRAGEAQS